MLHGKKAWSAWGNSLKKVRSFTFLKLYSMLFLLSPHNTDHCILAQVFHTNLLRQQSSQFSPANNLLPSRALVSSISSFHLGLSYLSTSHWNDWLPPHAARKHDNADWSPACKAQEWQKERGTCLGVWVSHLLRDREEKKEKSSNRFFFFCPTTSKVHIMFIS